MKSADDIIAHIEQYISAKDADTILGGSFIDPATIRTNSLNPAINDEPGFRVYDFNVEQDDLHMTVVGQRATTIFKDQLRKIEARVEVLECSHHWRKLDEAYKMGTLYPIGESMWSVSKLDVIEHQFRQPGRMMQAELVWKGQRQENIKHFVLDMQSACDADLYKKMVSAKAAGEIIMFHGKEWALLDHYVDPLGRKVVLDLSEVFRQ